MVQRHADKALVERVKQLRAGLAGTPLLPLADDELDIVAKLEFCNPTGSTKDRSALWILEQAIRRGEILPGTTVVESSSGNFALALAFYCRLLGIDFIPVIDPNCNGATEAHLRNLCRRVEMVSERDSGGGYLKTRLTRVQDLLVELRHAYWPNQYANPDALDAHYQFTAGELIKDAGAIDYLFVGVSTGGTIAGVSRRVKEAFPSCVVVAVDTEGSVIFGGPPKRRRIPGMGSSIVPPLCEQALIDEVEIVPEIRAAEAQADHGVRPESVGRFQDGESAPGADEGGSRVQQLRQGFGEGVGAGQAFGQFMERREVRDPAGEPVRQERSGAGSGRGDRWGPRGCGRGRDSVCGRGNR